MIRKTQHLTQREGIIFILSAPSGTGKTTLVKRLEADLSGTSDSRFPLPPGRVARERFTAVTTISLTRRNLLR